MVGSYALALPRRIVFGRGWATGLADAVAQRGRRVLLVRGQSVPAVDEVRASLVDAGCGLLTVLSRGEPSLECLQAAVARGRTGEVDVVLAIGGGSTIDLGKAAAAMIPQASDPLDHLEVVGRGKPLDAAPLPFVAAPTTAGTGAEATKNAVIGVSAARRKVSLRDDRMLADLALVDPALTDGAPPQVTLASGLDAVVQVIEPFLSARANPVTDALCRDAIPRGLAALCRLMVAEDPAARDALSHVSLMGGLALANAGLGAVHGLAGPLGGRRPAAHGALCGRLLPGILVENRRALVEAGKDLDRMEAVEAWVAEIFGADRSQAAETLMRHIDDWGLPRLADFGYTDADLDAVSEDAVSSSSMKANPVALTPTRLRAVLESAR